ncbi:hypothetical protein JIQ42_03069 [Leishmania sp. Namibia]|uniref:hypothetical protein n=1 Tax=Leishmania sp. Namibia TaxID=2802991 RepID=UPI001B710758|nr:hypothetical protein JIQ42_03069 [Leishmania sp. Namibia]
MFGNIARRTPVHLITGAACLPTLSPTAASPRLRASPPSLTVATGLRAFTGACHARSTQAPSTPSCGTLSAARRWASQYPTASRRTVRAGKKKHFNYLTADRMLPTEKKLSRSAIRDRDDASLQRRREYKQQLVRDVEEKIRFFPPAIKKQVFFPLIANSARVSLFRGNRDFGVRVSVRVFSMLVEQLCKRVHRDFILEQLAELGLDPPTAEDWERFTDPVTGDITTGIMYSSWVNTVLVTYGRMSFTGSKHLLACGGTTLFAYVVRHYHDRALVPPLEDWSRQYGPVVTEEFLGRPRGQQKVSLALSEAVYELRVWGRAQAQEAVSRLSLQEQEDLVRWVSENLKTHIAEMERKHAFTAKILAVMHHLPEAKSIHNSFCAFKEARHMEHVVKMKGAFFPLPSKPREEWRRMSAEEKERYTCFGRKRQTETACGRKLFLRYCCRDYGFSLTDASSRYINLSDLQKAALEFPFYLPLTPCNPALAAFRRFYAVMCERYGMVRTYNSGAGNRLFKIAMREQWDRLSMEERQQYEEHDRIYAVFPLQPTTSGAAASNSTASSSSESPPTRTAPSAAAPKSSGLTTRWGEPVKWAVESMQPASVGSQYFVEKQPPSLKVDDTVLTAESLLLNLRQAAHGGPRNGVKAKPTATATLSRATPSGAETAAVGGDEQQRSQQQEKVRDTQDAETPVTASRKGRARAKTPSATQGEGSAKARRPALCVVMI